MPTTNQSPLKIGIIMDTSLDPNDGVQQYIMAIGEWLRSSGQDVHYLVGETHERQLPNIHSLAKNFTVTFNGNKTTIPLPTSKRKLRAFVAKEKFDVLHVQTPHHPLMSQRLITAAPKRTVVVGTFHILPYNWLATIATKLLGLALKPSLKRVDQMLAVSPTAARFEERSFGVPATVLPNVIDYDRFHSATPLKKYQDDVRTILFLGRLVPRKGCLTLLQAIAKLRRVSTLPKFRVVICGKGELEQELKRYVAAEGLTDVVEFTGFISEEDKPRYYASADIAAFPSSSGESFGIVLLEAMASGQAAVLAGDNPGYRTVVEDRPEMLFAPKDSELLAQKLAELLTDEQKRRELAVWGQSYTKRFDVHAVGQELLALYRRLYNEKNMP